jgi:hypothetical protein
MMIAVWGRRVAAAAVAAVATLALAAPALAYPPVDIVHTEQVTAGPYHVTVGFSTWPIRAMRSLDFTFLPDGGIAGKSGTLSITRAGGPANSGGERTAPVQPLDRHPRKRDSWGLDVKALDNPGTYTFTFAVDGPQGHGVGALTGIPVLDQPGPPLALSWTVGTLPAIALIAFIVIAWRRVRPGKQPLFAP